MLNPINSLVLPMSAKQAFGEYLMVTSLLIGVACLFFILGHSTLLFKKQRIVCDANFGGNFSVAEKRESSFLFFVWAYL